jgi:N,N'-diacetyllegionaminate synthase
MQVPALLLKDDKRMMDGRIFIIAEAGVNHNGSLELAREMITQAATSGADAVKFQTFRAKALVSRFSPKAAYQMETSPKEETQQEMLERLEISPDGHRILLKEAESQGIRFLSTPFDLESIDLLDSLGLDIFKIPSGEIINLPYLRKIGKLKKKIILSTGMSDLIEVKVAVDILKAVGTRKRDMVLLHCTTQYPAPIESVNLKAMTTMGKALNMKFGYSDHTPGVEIPIAAAAMGAVMIEKHFTLDKSMEGPDHRASLDPDEFSLMVRLVRNVEKAMGSGIKEVSPAEIDNRVIVRKSIVAGTKILKGDIFTEKNLTTKRPGNGLSPMAWDSVMGRMAKRAYLEDEAIDL